ncbi:MAG: trypsin-like peptidase domain-containing protein [Gammaproteobacteria bacterium]|nr:trypsin-like peptidase domain-containing protein [Gammaproteobacteria bacterium]
MPIKNNSTHFLFGWALLGLIIGGLVLTLWPSLTKNGDDQNPFSLHNMGPVSYAAAVNKAASAVVSIKALRFAKNNSGLPDPLKNVIETPPLKPNRGSGVIMSDRGFILTNYHVIADADKILVTLNDGRQAEANILGSDPDTDLAVLAIQLQQLPEIRFADSNKIHVGDVVLAIGNPFGIGQTVTQGIISATGRDRVGLNTYENFIQTDAAINPGNSGGALINAYGEIVGINSATLTQSGISFAIPIDMALDVVQQMFKHGGVIRGWLGVEGGDINPQMLQQFGLQNIQGVLITDVFTNGPADLAGLEVGDIITQINQTSIRDTRDVLNIVAQGKPGDKILIAGIRQRQSFMTTATLDQRPQSSNL